MMKKYLFIGIADHPLLIDLASNIKKKDPACKIDVLPIKHINKLDNSYDKIHHLPLYEWYSIFIKTGSSFVFKICIIIWSLFQKRKYDIVEIHYCSLLHKDLIRFYKNISNKVIAVLWGSDIFRIPVSSFSVMKQLLTQCDIVNCSTEQMYDRIKVIIGNELPKDKLRKCRFGLEILNEIKKIKNLNISKEQLAHSLKFNDFNNNSIIITVGSNGSEGQQHLKIINSISNFNYKNVTFIFPITYGLTNKYYLLLLNALKDVNFSYYILTDYLSAKNIATLRSITDVFIQLQISDALSGAMQEHMFAGNIVITGSWLKYDILKNNGIYFENIECVDQVGTKLDQIINSIEKFKDRHINNPNAIWKLSSWEHCINSWREL